LFELTLTSNDTSKLQRGPNLLKIFANSKQAFRPDIYIIPLLTVNSISPENLRNVVDATSAAAADKALNTK
jgi:S-methylmethionine-dependent homocysteine/selenocysteine methylase